MGSIWSLIQGGGDGFNPQLLLKLEMKKLFLVLLWEVMVEIEVLDEALVEVLEILRWR